MAIFENQIKKLLNKAGVEINGTRDFDIQIHSDKAYGRVVKEGTMGLGESYMDGWWDVKKLDEFFYKVMAADLEKDPVANQKSLMVVKSLLINMQSRRRAFQVGEKHYDIGNDLYEKMLGKTLVYSCGYWKDAKNLDEAQEAKMDLICRKLQLKKGEHILDIGCGWGSLLKFAAEHYGVSGVGVTVSKEQKALAQKNCAGLPVTFELQDYRNLTGTFDKIVSVGMFEHVGFKNYNVYMKKVFELLKDDGLFLLHTIAANVSETFGDPWMNKYIFPNGQLPSIIQIGKASEGLWVMEDWHNFGAYYDKTLMAWHENFENSWPQFKEKYGERFYRMWNYYLLSCAAGFRARKIQLWQIVFSKKGVPDGYQSVR